MSTSPKNNKNKDKDKKNQNKNKNKTTKDISNNDLFFNIGGININNPLLSPLLNSKEDKNNNIKKHNIENNSDENKSDENNANENKLENPINQNEKLMTNKSQSTIPSICFNIVEKSNKNIKTNVTNKNMRLNTILKNIEDERENNKKTINHLKNISKTLEETNNELKNIKIVPSNNPVTKKIIDDLIKDISENYEKINDLHHGENSKNGKNSENNKNNTNNQKQKKEKDENFTRKFPLFPPGFLLRNNSAPPQLRPPAADIFNMPPPTHRRTESMYIPPHAKNFFTNASQTPIPPPPPPIKKEYKEINVEINGLKDILKLIEDYPLSPAIEYNINMESIHKIKEPLSELDRMIGMNKLKNSIVDQVIYFIQNLHINNNAVNPDFMHTCIYGPPGTGKTEVAKIMGKIFSSMGVLKKNYFRKVTRADLIAGYLGQTAIKTRDVVKEALGGVLFIDEAYALGNSEKRDSFAKECIDTLCECLSDNKEQLMVIIAGYEEDLKKCFFAYNQGLNSRFPWRFKTDDYNAEELNLIFQKKIQDAGWSLKENIPNDWFESKKEHFKFFGRDMETLLAKAKIAHGRRVFCKPKSEKMKLNLDDLEKGYKMFIENNGKKDVDLRKTIIDHMYL